MTSTLHTIRSTQMIRTRGGASAGAHTGAAATTVGVDVPVDAALPTFGAGSRRSADVNDALARRGAG